MSSVDDVGSAGQIISELAYYFERSISLINIMMTIFQEQPRIKEKFADH